MGRPKTSDLKSQLADLLVNEADESPPAQASSREGTMSLIERHPHVGAKKSDEKVKRPQESESAIQHNSQATLPIQLSNLKNSSEPTSASGGHEGQVRQPGNSSSESEGDQKSAVTLNPSTAVRADGTRAEVHASLNPGEGTNYFARENVPLMHTEHLRLAQERILELEDIVSQLRVDNEQISAAAEALKNRTDELTSKIEGLETHYREKLEALTDEKLVFENQLRGRAKEKQDLLLKIEELEMRLNTDLKRVRVRERELENRLELVKIEGQAVVRSKDEMLLEHKRKIDQLAHELDNFRLKSKDLNKRHEGQQERIRRTVKALRLALSMLEGDDTEAEKKPEGA